MNNIMRIINNIFPTHACNVSQHIRILCFILRYKINSATCRRTACSRVLYRNV